MTQSPIQQDLAEIAARLGWSVPADVPAAARAGQSGLRLASALRQAAEEALAAYRASPDHAALQADLGTLSLADFEARMAAALNGPHFATLLQMLREPASFDIDLGDLMPKAVSLGVMAQAVLVVGIGGSVGYAMNISLSDFASCVYAGGAVDGGIDAGLEGNVCLGLWREAVGDLGGIYVGEEVDIADGGGFDEACFLNFDPFDIADEELSLVFLGVELGIDDGMEGIGYCFFEFQNGSPTIYQPGDATYLVQFGTITCNNSMGNYDVVTLEFLQDSDDTVYRFPAWGGYQMAEKDNNSQCYQWNMGLVAKFDSSLTLRLQLHDTDSTLDHTMKDVTISASNFGGVGSTYTVPWDETINVFDEISYSVVVTLLKN